MNDWFRRHAPWLGAALIVVLIGAAYVLRADGSAHAQSAAAPRSAALAASAVSASPSASPASATRRRSFALSAGKSSFRTLAPSSTPGRPGIRTPPPSAGALAQSLRRATGLSPSQVTTRAVCPAVGAGQARCAARALVLRASGALVRPRPGTGRALGRVRSATAAASAAAAAAPDPATPAYLQQAYDLTALSQQAGSGDTVAIVDAYNDPTAESDLGVFRTAYGLPACTKANGCFRKVNQTGGTSSLPAANSDWESEVSLDLDAVSAICPNCHILLVEANSSNLTDLVASMQTASSMGANQISDSWWGSSRVSGRYTFPGVATVAATGDNGYVPSGAAYPAAYPGVTAAGGTSLASATSNVRGFGEQAWSGGGSGCNGVYPRPSYQPNIGCSGRVFADLSADADPDTGLKIYTPGGWAIYGGTSLAAPLIAAYYAITGVSATTPQWAYSDSGLLNDVVTGSNGTCSNAALCNGEIGYDGPTGVGSISGTVATGAPGVAGPAYTSGTQNTYTQSVGSQGATVGGGIYRNGLDTTWWIEYGTSQAYGSVTSPVDIGAGTAPIAVTGSLTGLTPGTLYHYRLVAKNALGTTYGYDYTLTTAPATAPSAAFTVSPSVPTPSAPVSFDASGSVAGTGGTISHYSWDFGDGTQHTGTTPTDSHQYATRGNYTVTLTITNSRGQTSTTTQAVAVDNPPTAAVTPSTTFTAPATSVSFNASGSSAGAGGTIKDYSWGFGDGTAKDSGPTASTTHAFASPGVYTVTLTVTDDLNVANSTTAVITVDQPNASFTATPATVAPGGTVSFDATGSTDPHDTITDYRWNFGDGTSQDTGTTPTASHPYTNRGNWTVTLTITNSHNQTSSSTQTVTADTPPTAAVTPSTGWTGPATPVTFDASGSRAGPGGTIKDYGWDFGDGTAIEHTGTTSSATHAFASPGVYTVKLTATDDLHVANSTTAVITVDQPNASFTATPATVAPGGTISFDGTGSTDPHDTISDYTWNFGDGTRLDTLSTPTTSHPYVNRGHYAVSLTVTSSHNQTSTTTQTVTADNPPIPTFTASATTMTAGSPVTFNGSASTAGSISDYTWNFGDGTSRDTGSTSSTAYTFASAGTYTVMLTTTDDLGVSATATRQFTVQAPVAATSTPPTTPASSTPAPTPAPTTAPTPAPSPSPSPTLTGALTATQKQRLAFVLAHGVRISVSSSASASIRFQITVPRAAFKSAATGRKSKGAPIVLLRTGGQTLPAGTHAFSLKLPAWVRHKLSTTRRLVLTVQVTLTAGGHTINRSLKITLAR